MQIETHYPVRVRHEVMWGEQDMLGHVNNTWYFRYFENARIDHFEAIQMVMPDKEGATCGPILASTRCDFLLPVTFPDTLRVDTGVIRMGNSSYVAAYRVWSERQQTYVARGEAVNVFYDYAAQKSVSLPSELRERILHLENSCQTEPSHSA